MRIVGGEFRGRALSPVGRGDPSARLRPTADRVRESLFNVLASGPYADLDGARVLDLFAGTGALGLEALSRGAARAVLVETGRAGRDLIGRNIALLGVEGRAKLLARDATRLGAADAAFDLVFLDPPYGRGLGERALSGAMAGGWIAAGATVVWEESSGASPEPVAGLRVIDRRRYGDTGVTFLTADGP